MGALGLWVRLRRPLTIVIAALALSSCSSSSSPKQPSKISLLTALPLFWLEGQFGEAVTGVDQRAPLVQKLSERFEVSPLDALSGATLKNVDVLVLAQPRALAPAELVELDRWVRAGGKLLIFADPMLDWPSLYPMGDPRRPPLVTLLDPLFDHWGLDLSAPEVEQGREIIELDGEKLALVGAGHWTLEDKAKGLCTTRANDFLAQCALGKGRVLLLGDADVLDSRVWEETGIDNVTGIESLVTQLHGEDAK
jgi:ABC-type uncharacterized transport system